MDALGAFVAFTSMLHCAGFFAPKRYRIEEYLDQFLQ